MELFQNEPLALIVGAGWIQTALFFLAVDFGMLMVCTIIDLALLRGFNRPAGNLSYWMIAVYDTIVMPVAAGMAARFYLTANSDHTLPASGWITVISIVLAIAGAELFRRHENADVARGLTNWTIDGNGRNIVGWYHLIVFGLIVQFFSSVLIRGGLYLTLEFNLASLGYYLGSTPLMVVGLIVVVVLLDNNPAVRTPNELTGWPSHRMKKSN